MDGLECSEVFFSYAKRSNAIFRIDSFYYSKEFLGDENNIDAINTISFKELNADIKSFGAYSLNNDVEYIDDGIPFIRGVNIKNGRVNFSNMIYISEESHRLLWKSEVVPSTILLSMSGTIGDVALARDNWDYPINSNQDIAKIILNQNYNSYLACAFLLSKYGQNFMLREARGSVQQHVYLSQIETLKLPIFSDDLVEVIERLMLESDNYYDLSEKKYIESTDMLLSALNIKDFTIPEQSASVKKLSESFGSSGRLDAEYYQSKYDRYERLISDYAHGCSTVRYLFDPIKTKCFRTEEYYRYVEIGDINVGDGSMTFNIIATENLPDNAKILTQKGDLIVSTVRPNRGAVAIAPEDGLLVSGAFTVLRQKLDYPKEVLQVLFRTPLYRDWLLKYNVGTSYPVIKDEDVLNMPLPLFDEQIQQDIIKDVQESFALRHQSEQLLENAKCAVEIAIEQGEGKAMEWLKDKVVM